MLTGIIISVLLFVGLSVYAEEYQVSIPFGAYNPELNTPAKVWYDPPLLKIESGDTVTWINNDREGHTVTSGEGAGRFGWMSGKQFGKSDGLFDSDRFLPGESWTHTFDSGGAYGYFCTIHPWMEGVILVGDSIPSYPTDGFGNKIESFPLLQYTPDQTIEVNLTWEPNIIKTHEKITFVYQFYDPSTNSNLAKMNYDFVLIQNGNEIYRDTGLNQIGGDFRNYAFEESGPVIIRFEGIEFRGAIGEESTTVAGQSESKAARTVEFSTIVYTNPEKISHEDFHIKPAQRLEFYYELAIVIILIPAGIFVGIIIWMKKSPNVQESKSSPI